jgi:hypothetical protein
MSEELYKSRESDLSKGDVERPADVTSCDPLHAEVPGSPDRTSRRKRAAILVLGVHRSGTSSLTRIFNLLGAKLPKEVLGPGYGNVMGHWEPRHLMEINDEILAATGRTWADVRPMPANWFRSKDAYRFHERIVAEIAASYGDAPLILIKEPRICRLAPLYLDALDALGIEPLVILPIRHPEEVIRSIQDRDGLDPRAVEFLWLRSLAEAEEVSRDCARVWTSFDQLLENWQTTLQSISDGLGLTWPTQPAEVFDEVAEVVRPRHRHYRAAESRAPLQLSSLTMSAWRAAQRALAGDESGTEMIFDEIRTTISDVDWLGSPQLECLEKALSRADERALDAERAYHQELQGRDRRIAELETNLSELESKLLERTTEGDRLREQAESYQRQAESLRHEAESLRGSLCWRLTSPIRLLHAWARRGTDTVLGHQVK